MMVAGFQPVAWGARFPQRIATPDRGGTQTLLVLGQRPVVSVSKDFYDEMGATPALADGIPNAGYPAEPNLELLQFYAVDLIVTVTISRIVQRQLARVAPVIALDIYRGAEDTFEQACAETRRLAKRIGRPLAAERYIDSLAQLMAETAQKLATIPYRKLMITALSSDGRHMTVYGKNSIMSGVLKRLGFEDGWRGTTNHYGFTNTGIETLIDYPDVTLLVVNYGEDTRAALTLLQRSALWQALPVVKNRQVLQIGLFEIFGGLPLAEQFTHKLQDALLRPIVL
jgi:iron complex transport system substrate-binding protein